MTLSEATHNIESEVCTHKLFSKQTYIPIYRIQGAEPEIFWGAKKLNILSIWSGYLMFDISLHDTWYMNEPDAADHEDMWPMWWLMRWLALRLRVKSPTSQCMDTVDTEILILYPLDRNSTNWSSPTFDGGSKLYCPGWGSSSSLQITGLRVHNTWDVCFKTDVFVNKEWSNVICIFMELYGIHNAEYRIIHLNV